MNPLTFVLVFVAVTLSGILLIESVYGQEYIIKEITKEYKLSTKSDILKTEGYTTTGEMFFLRQSPDFEKLMILDLNGNWVKDAVLKEETEIEIEVIQDKIIYQPKIDFIVEQDFTTYWNQEYNIEVRTYDLNINPFPDKYQFEGKLNDAEILVTISFEDELISLLNGSTEYGSWNGAYFFSENISSPGLYNVDVLVSHSGKSVYQSFEMFVIGTVPDSGGKSCPPGTSKVNGNCV